MDGIIRQLRCNDQPTKPDWPPPDLTITAAEIAEVLAAIAQNRSFKYGLL